MTVSAAAQGTCAELTIVQPRLTEETSLNEFR